MAAAATAVLLLAGVVGCSSSGTSPKPGSGGQTSMAAGGQSGSSSPGSSGGSGGGGGNAGMTTVASGGATGSASGGSTGSGGNSGGGTAVGGTGGENRDATVDAPADLPSDRAGDTAALPATAWVYNIVNASYVDSIKNILDETSGVSANAIAKEFYKSFPDDYDFLYLLAEVESSAASGVSIPVRWDGTSGVGRGPATDDQSWGSTARLKQVIVMGTLVKGTVISSGPTLHETLHYWGVYLDTSFGFEGVHWGKSSADGLLGGFNRDSLVCRDTGAKPTGTMPSCPLDSSGRMKTSVAPFSSCCISDIKKYSDIELYLMGLLPASDVNSLWVMDDPVYEGPVWTDASTNIAAMNYNVSGLHVVTVNEIIAKHGARPAATQTAFHAAFIMVTAQPATQTQLDTIALWARRFSGEEHTPTSGIISFSDATSGRATMTTQLRP